MTVAGIQAVSRPTILEYAGVLVAIDQIIGEYSSVDDTNEEKLAKARKLATLIHLLHDMQCMGLQGSSVLRELAEAVKSRGQPVFNAVFSQQPTSDIIDAMESFVYVNLLLNVKTDVASVAVNPENWVDGLGNPISIQSALSDSCFFDFYRSADAMIVSDMGALANRLQASQQFLNALNDVYSGASWNPGTAYISLEGTLQDYTSSTGYNSWYDKFNEDGIPSTMINGVINIQTMLDSGIFPVDSLEYKVSSQICSIFNQSYSTGGYGQVATADGAARMWSDRTFKMTLQNGIDGTSRLNEERQLDLARVLTVYDFFVRTATNLVTRESEMNRNIANHVKDI